MHTKAHSGTLAATAQKGGTSTIIVSAVDNGLLKEGCDKE
jgi:hypothetical protein